MNRLSGGRRTRKTQPPRSLRRSRRNGMALIELMIGLTLGLLLLLALSYFFLGSRQTGRVHTEISRIQESGRNALEMLTYAIRQAGARADVDAAFPGGNAVGGMNAASDTLVLRYVSQGDGEVDCVGTAVAAGATASFTFSVNAARELGCSGTVIAENIEDFQVEYGVDDNRDGAVEAYRSADGVVNFARVAAIRVHLVVRGPHPNLATGSQSVLFLGAQRTHTDGFLRQVYSLTQTVRNQAG